MRENILFSTNPQKILSFLLRHPEREYFDREISKLTKVSRAGTNLALRALARSGLVVRTRRGRMYFYKVLLEDKLVQQLKIVETIVFLWPLVEKLKNSTVKIILYGTAAQGINVEASDIDLLIVTREEAAAKRVIFRSKYREKLHALIRSPGNFIKQKHSNNTFYDEVKKGIVLWESK